LSSGSGEPAATAREKGGRKSGRRKKAKTASTVLGKDTIENLAWRSLADTYRTVHFQIMSDLRHYGLTPPQYSVLRTIGRSERGFLPMSEIGKAMIVTYANITTIVDNLEKRNLVRRIRNKDDRRMVYVEFTPRGAKLFAKIYKSHRKHITMLMQAISPQELETLRTITTKIRNRIAERSTSSSSYFTTQDK